MKRMVKQNVPQSSRLYSIAYKYKDFSVHNHERSDSFFSAYMYLCDTNKHKHLLKVSTYLHKYNGLFHCEVNLRGGMNCHGETEQRKSPSGIFLKQNPSAALLTIEELKEMAANSSFHVKGLVICHKYFWI